MSAQIIITYVLGNIFQHMKYDFEQAYLSKFTTALLFPQNCIVVFALNQNQCNSIL